MTEGTGGKRGIEDKIEKTKWMSCMKKFNRNRGTIIYIRKPTFAGRFPDVLCKKS